MSGEIATSVVASAIAARYETSAPLRIAGVELLEAQVGVGRDQAEPVVGDVGLVGDERLADRDRLSRRLRRIVQLLGGQRRVREARVAVGEDVPVSVRPRVRRDEGLHDPDRLPMRPGRCLQLAQRPLNGAEVVVGVGQAQTELGVDRVSREQVRADLDGLTIRLDRGRKLPLH